MTSDTKFLRIQSKIDRAQKHIDDFNAEVIKFRRENPNALSTITDKEADNVTFYVAHVPEIAS